MHDREYFLTTSLSYQLQAARRELADFRSGEAYRKLRADYEDIIRERNLTVKKLRKERDDFSFSVYYKVPRYTMYFARKNKGHAGIRETPVENFGGILIHDHEACFYGYGSDHQECMVHIERYLRDSMENEKDLTWNGQMLKLIQEMIHENNTAPAEGIADERIAEFEKRYDSIVQTASEEYEATPPSDYYRDGYNLYLRMVKYKHNHLLFLSHPLVEPDNNLCERKARILKGKINQAVSLRSLGHLEYFCECLSVLDHFATDGKNNLYQSIKEVFRRPKPVIPKSEYLESAK